MAGEIMAMHATGNRTHVETLAWYWRRLRAMSGAEIAHRCGEAVKRRISALRGASWAEFDLGDGDLPSLAFPEGALDRVDPALLTQWREAAAALRTGRITLLGQAWPGIGGAAKWHLDPVTGGTWPQRDYCFDIAYRREKRLGDVKYVWELNRLQYLQPVAALAAYEGDEKLAARCLGEIESWIDANPPFRGVNWASGIELALRVVSLLVIIGLLGAERVEPYLRRKIRACLAAHAYWLARYPSCYSSANNHLVAEAGALFLLGALWPELKQAQGQLEAARWVLIEEAAQQIHDDGVGAEQSPTYTAFTLEWYLLALRVAEERGQPLPKSVLKRVGRAGRFLRWIMDDAAECPRIGDDDEGRVIASAPGETGYVASVLASIASLLGRQDLAPPIVRASLRGLYFGLPQPCTSGPKGARIFLEGGYSVFRRKVAGRSALLVMDHGPLGHLSIAAHGHADALSLWLHIDGRPVLVDAGTYLYHSGGDWRRHLRGTPLHNTLALDGRNSSTIAGPFNWSSKANCSLIEWKNASEGVCARAQHDGYRRSHGLLHERHLIAHTRGFSVRDSLVCAGGRRSRKPEISSIGISFLVSPDLDVIVEGANATISCGKETLLRVHGGRGLALELVHGNESPALGWYSRRFGSIEPAPQLLFRALDPSARQFQINLEVVGASQSGTGKKKRRSHDAARVSELALVALEPDRVGS